MSNDENNPRLHDTKTNSQVPSAAKPANTTSSALPKNEGTNLKEYNNLMPKTIEEIKEIQARGRKLLIKKKYIKRSRFGLQQQQPKSEEELKLEQLQREKDIKELPPQIMYSPYYQDDEYEYRHVVLPKNLARWLPQNRLLKKEEWIQVGVHQSSGWEHYMIYKPEPHILLFKREKNYLMKHGDHDPQYPPEEIEDIKRQQQALLQQQKEQRKQQQQQKSTVDGNDALPTLTQPLHPAPAP
ncbi:regulatory subunit of cyclin-dependent kinase [Mucor lusitanicus]|uniref:Cyclin-dependent kinases regulatory subunit n=2 Tax=Mucor circinelloides f. lusitanicus TaxID=29924 RepID=A0A8H4EXN8_MUCCL|nr:regulatory subunit of cyclin-dependent kinase [Mucor lusitanicus]